jgi:hypothetical protein
MEQSRMRAGYTIGGAAVLLVLFLGFLALPDIIRYVKIERM